MFKVYESDKEVLYSVLKPSEITSSLVASIIVPCKSLRIEWPRQELRGSFFTDETVSYHLQIGMEADSLSFDSSLSSLPTIKLDDQNTKRLVAQSYEIGYSRSWKGTITERTIHKFGEALNNLANSRNTHFIEVDGQMAGVVFVQSLKTYRGILEDHLGWIWIDSKLPKPTRLQVSASLLKSAAEMATGKILASVFSRNYKSISLLSRAGFQSICVVIEPLD